MPTYAETATGKVEHLGIMLRVHARHQYISPLLSDIHRHLGRQRKVTVTIGADRPSPKVIAAVARMVDNNHRFAGRFLNVHEIPASVCNAGAGWMAPVRYLHECHRQDVDASGFGPSQACMLIDDDALFTARGLREIRGHLNDFAYDRLDVRHLFCWDAPDLHNAGVPPHWSAGVFRVLEGDDFPTNFVVRCPERVARSQNVCRLSEPVHELGWLKESDRKAAFAAAKAAGRLDGHTLSLVRTPNLQRINGDRTK